MAFDLFTSDLAFRMALVLVICQQVKLSAISNWLAHNCMSVNAAKCKYMLISRKRSSLASTLPALFIGSPEATMEKVTCMKYLGVHISWSIHIDIITSKARRTLGLQKCELFGANKVVYHVGSAPALISSSKKTSPKRH